MINKLFPLSLAILCLAFTYNFRLDLHNKAISKVVETKHLYVDGYITSLPQRSNGNWRFNFSTDANLVKLSWKTDKQIHAGERWQLPVILKKIHGSKSPGAFDYEHWALQQGFIASGRVTNKDSTKLLSHHWYYYPFDQFRESMNARIKSILPKMEGAIWLQALVLGVREDIPAAYWQVLRRTGTNHMMAIGGLHIGVISGFVYLMASRFWRLNARLLIFMPAQYAGSIAGLMAALFYTILAGFSIPTQRACVMFATAVLARLLQKRINPWRTWFIAFFIVLLINPFDVLSQSFWLSFMTIALIIYAMSGRLAPHGMWWRWGRVQWVVAIGLAPLTLFYFQESSVISFIANTIAIPWLSFLILPLSFLASLLSFISFQFASQLMWLAGFFMYVLWQLLTMLADLPLASWQLTMPNIYLFILLLLAVILLLSPKGFPAKPFTVLWLLPLFLFQHSHPSYGEFRLHILDVGQGLSTIVQTRKHVLIYDTGPGISQDKDAGSDIILPFLRSNGIKSIDHMVISHGDNDHIGGAASIISAMPVLSVSSSVPDKIPHFPAIYCLAGTSWNWDGVHFKFLYPSPHDLGLNNNSSCVLKISNESVSVLLPGDIEKRAEIELLKKYQHSLDSTVLLAPHHGSKTSSMEDFIKAVNPVYVVYATGYLNRFGFPHLSIVDRYTKLGIIQYNTAITGSITFNSKSVNQCTRLLSKPSILL